MRKEQSGAWRRVRASLSSKVLAEAPYPIESIALVGGVEGYCGCPNARRGRTGTSLQIPESRSPAASSKDRANANVHTMFSGIVWAQTEGHSGGLPLMPIVSASKPHRLPSSIVQDDEPGLFAAPKSGDRSYFEELVRRYEAKIFRLTQNITQNREDAEDAMQDAFLKAYSHLQGFQGDSRFYTWLVRIAANEALMRLRKRRPGQMSLDEPIQGDTDLMPRELEDWGPNPEQKFAQTEIGNVLNEFIERLEPENRIVLMLRDVEELSTEETAKVLGISISAVKSRLLRARLRLRE